MKRFHSVFIVAAAMAACVLPSASGVAPKGQMVLEPFGFKGIKLDDGFLKAQVTEVKDFYLRIPNDDLLKGFRQRAGLPAPGKPMGGWYDQDIGNIFGQVLSGLSRLYAATGDIACKEKADALLHEWGKCIAPDGYFFYTNKTPGKAYTYDKTVGGLVDMYIFCGNTEGLDYLKSITEWAEKNLNRSRDYANADPESSPRCGWGEWYTLSENLYRAYLATGDNRYLVFGKVWEYPEFWNLFPEKVDIFGVRKDGGQTGAYHAYSHVNSFASAGAAYLVSGDKHYLDVLKSAYDFMQANEVYATGGFGPNEQLLPHDQVIKLLRETDRSFETQCGSWAAFKMSKYLITLTGDARYGDWIERLVYNGIGASIPNEPEGYVFYYSNYRTGGDEPASKQPGMQWACCSGTRPEAIAEYYDLVYFKGSNELCVNLYTPSTVRWNGVVISQKTGFPERPIVEFTVSADKPVSFDLKFRVPGWLQSPMTAEVNGKPVQLNLDSLHWAGINRKWRNGDKVVLTIPMDFWLSRMDAKRGYPAAVMYGPVTMAFRGGSDPSKKVDFSNIKDKFIPSPGEALTYHLADDSNVLLRPFYAYKKGEPYVIYLDPD